MNAYIINLKSSIDRRKYMEQLLKSYCDILEAHFVEAVDGRGLSDNQLENMWNQRETYKTYGRHLKGGEIGCSLSHRRCYEEMLKNGDEVALILEDDVVFEKNANVRGVVTSVNMMLQTEKPVVVLLSGSYWFFRKKSLLGVDCRLASVFEAMGSMSYMINRSAAEMMLAADKKYLADDWYNWQVEGVMAYAVHPHIAGDFDLFKSDIADNYEGWHRENLSFVNKVRACYRAVIRRCLGRIGHWEKREF